jgi:endonuclease YncB( thermonuclease family)
MPPDTARLATPDSPSDGSSLPSLGEWDRLRGQVRAEIAARGAFPVARRTLELIVETALEPSEEPPGYRVVDRVGEPRLRGENEDAAPLTLADLVDELQERHPALFPRPPEPEPAPPEPPPEPAGAKIKAAAARLVDAGAASGALSSLRARFQAVPPPVGTPAQAAPSADAAPTPHPVSEAGRARLQAAAETVRQHGNRAGGRARVGLRRTLRFARRRGAALGEASERLRERIGDASDLRSTLSRPSVLAGIGGLGLVGVVTLFALRGGSDAPPATPPVPVPAAPPAAAPPASPPTAAEPEDETPPDETATEPSVDPPAEEPPPANAVSGPAEVIDTATLKVGGKVVRLFGVEWVRGGQREELTRYLAGRPVSCQPVAGSEAYRCTVSGRDLSEVVLFNGGGRASPEATPDLVAAEDRARTERLGVWAR